MRSRSTGAGFPLSKNFTTGITRNERYLRNERPLARVAMVYSQQTAAFYGGEHARDKGGRSLRSVFIRRSSKREFRLKWCTMNCSMPSMSASIGL